MRIRSLLTAARKLTVSAAIVTMAGCCLYHTSQSQAEIESAYTRIYECEQTIQLLVEEVNTAHDMLLENGLDPTTGRPITTDLLSADPRLFDRS